MDEAHKTGAKLLSQALEEIKENGSYDLFIGASAHSRRTDQIHTVEDQADVMFDGNVIGNFNLDYCFDNGILTMPEYYYCEATLTDEIEEEIYRLQRSKIPEYIKNNLIENLRTVKLAYENYSSLKKTLERGFENFKDRENLKIIIFISRIDKYEEAKELFSKSINEIFPGKDVYCDAFFSTSNKNNLNKFLERDGICVLFTVDKLNLSLHHEDLNICIMYRKTTSTIVYEQQCGRVLFKDKPGCIIDIVDNGHSVRALEYSGEKSGNGDYIVSSSRHKNSFSERMYSEFTVNYSKFKEIINLIKSKNYKNLSVEYKGESNSVKYFIDKYRVVMSDVFYFLSKEIPFERALEAARTEYYVTIEGKEYSASSLGQRFGINADELRYEISTGNFRLTSEMKEFFNIQGEEETFEDISIKIQDLEELLKNRD